jgi:hypothetical protein
MAVRKQPEVQPFYGAADGVMDGQVLDAVVVKSGGNEKVLVSRWHLGIPRRRLLVQAGIILLAVLCLGALRLMTSQEDASSTVQVEDTKALLDYRRDLGRIASEMSDRSRIYRQQSEQAASRRDLIGLFDAANSYQTALKGFAARTNALALPRLDNRRAQEFAAAAQGELKASLTRLEAASLQMVEAVDRGEIRAAAFTATQSAMRFLDQAASRQDVMLKNGLALLGNGPREQAKSLP